MLSLPTSVRVYLARGATDMRKSIDGLAAVTKQVLEHDPLSGHLFVFCNARRDRIKILYWERTDSGCCTSGSSKARLPGQCPKAAMRRNSRCPHRTSPPCSVVSICATRSDDVGIREIRERETLESIVRA